MTRSYTSRHMISAYIAGAILGAALATFVFMVVGWRL